MKKVSLKLSVELAGMLILGVSMLAMHHYYAATGVMFAMIFISSTLDRVRNKLEKNVFSRNKSGDYMRLRSKPSNPKTQAQMNSRGSFTQISKQWKALTPVMREQWNKYASVNPVSNKLGVQIYLSGFNWYMKKNIPLHYMGLDQRIYPWDTDDVKQTFYKDCKVGYDENTGVLSSFKINYTGGSENPNVYYEVFMSRQVSSGVTSYRSVTYTYLTRIPSNCNGQIELIDALRARNAIWTNKDFEKMVYFKIRQVSATYGTADAWWAIGHIIN